MKWFKFYVKLGTIGYINQETMSEGSSTNPIKDVARGLDRTVRSNVKIIAVLFIISICLFVTSLALFLVMNLDTSLNTCEYNGQVYKAGENFQAEDGCNTCTCGDDRQVSCTLIYCDTRANQE